MKKFEKTLNITKKHTKLIEDALLQKNGPVTIETVKFEDGAEVQIDAFIDEDIPCANDKCAEVVFYVVLYIKDLGVDQMTVNKIPQKILLEFAESQYIVNVE